MLVSIILQMTPPTLSYSIKDFSHDGFLGYEPSPQCFSLKENLVFHTVTPAKTGVQKRLKRLDSGQRTTLVRFRRNDTRQLPHQAQGPD